MNQTQDLLINNINKHQCEEYFLINIKNNLKQQIESQSTIHIFNK